MLLVLSFIAFSLFLPPLELFSDGTDFSMAASCLGIPHPPSYPLYMLLNRAFYFLPLGNAAFRLSCCSAFFAATVVYIIWRLYEGGRLEKLFLCLFVALIRTFFDNATNGEAYSLNILLFFLIYFTAARMRDRRCYYLAFFLLGLGLGNHHTTVFMSSLLVIEIVRHKSELAIKDHLTAILFIILGVSVYLYLPVRVSAKPRWDWGAPGTLSYFKNSLLRGDFSHTGYLRDMDTLWAQLRTFNPVSELGVLNTLFVAGSMLTLAWKESGKFVKMMVLILCYSLVMIFLLGNDGTKPEEMADIYKVFFVPAFCVMGVMAADVLKRMTLRIKAILILLLVTGAVYNCADLMKSGRKEANGTFAHDLAKTQLSMLPRDSVLIMVGAEKDFPVLYQQIVCRYREDIRFVNLATLGRKWNYRESLELGIANTTGYSGETDDKKRLLKGVVLFQNSFYRRPVFCFVPQKEHLPDSLSWSLNGLFWSYPDTGGMDLGYIRTRSLSADMAGVMEDILYTDALASIEKGQITRTRDSVDLLKSFARDKAAVDELSRRIGRP